MILGVTGPGRKTRGFIVLVLIGEQDRTRPSHPPSGRRGPGFRLGDKLYLGFGELLGRDLRRSRRFSRAYSFAESRTSGSRPFLVMLTGSLAVAAHIQTAPAHNPHVFRLRLAASSRRARLTLSATERAIDGLGAQSMPTGSHCLQTGIATAAPENLYFLSRLDGGRKPVVTADKLARAQTC